MACGSVPDFTSLCIASGGVADKKTKLPEAAQDNLAAKASIGSLWYGKASSSSMMTSSKAR
ncbi:hypothetical protein D3C81_1881090 [compost metagenome]